MLHSAASVCATQWWGDGGGDLVVGVERLFLTTPERVAQVVRSRREGAGLSQAALAARAGVGRRFVMELEAGHPRAELGKVLAVLSALGVHATALPGPPMRSGDDVDLHEVVSRFA